MTRRVVITGMGIISPLGHSVKTTWAAITAGKSGVDFLKRFDTDKYNVKIAAEVKQWDPSDYMPVKEARRRDPNQQYAYAAAQEAIRDAQFSVTEANRIRTGVFIGSAVGGVDSYYKEAEMIYRTGEPRKITPFGIPMLIVNASSNIISIETGAMGTSATPISACATGADCIGHAFNLIRLGRIDQALAGCGEAPIMPLGIAAFDRTGAVSRQSESPETASRPFDKHRSGLVFSEGAGVVALELLEHAQARGASIYGELVGYGSTSDGFHITAPHPEGIGAIAALQQALDDAHLNVTDIDYINAHGTATTLNDASETKAVKHVFGEHAYQLPMSSTKSMTGHAMGATAAMEAIFSLLAIRDQVAPPTINYHDPDPDCDLDYVPNTARQMPIHTVMSNSFGFGGHNASLIFSKFEN